MFIYLKHIVFFNEKKKIMPKLLLNGVNFIDKCNGKLIKLLIHYTVYTSGIFFFLQYSLRGLLQRNIACPIKLERFTLTIKVIQI